jgi:hypothetical protein
VLPTLVFVALPAETSPTDIETLLAACNQTYIEGECRADARADATPNLAAEVRWIGEGRARVNLRFTLKDTPRTMTRALEFRTEDEVSEQFRALGFVVGSLAGTATEQIRVEEQTRAAQPIDKPVATKLDPNEDRPPAAQPRAVEPPTGERPAEEPTTAPAPPRDLRGRFRIGAASGSGVQSMRWGGTLGASAIWDRSWLLDLHGAYTRENGDAGSIDAQFFAFGVSAGFESQAGPWALGIGVGPRFVQLQAGVGAEEDSSPPALGAQLSLNLRYVTSVLSPYIELDAITLRRDKILLDDRELQLNPIQLQFALGFTFPDLTVASPKDGTTSSSPGSNRKPAGGPSGLP